MPELPLNETALQAAQEKAEYADYGPYAYDRELISTYLREAGFGVEEGPVFGGRRNDTKRRLVGPWVLVDQAESEEE